MESQKRKTLEQCKIFPVQLKKLTSIYVNMKFQALKFKNMFRWLQLCFSMIMKHRQSKIVVQQGITQFLQFLEPETGLAFSCDATLEC